MKTILMTACAALLLTGTAMADSNIVKTRVTTMEAIGGGLGVLGGMLRGRTDYDSATAQSAADAILAAVSSADAATLFPEGTDELSINGTRAKVDIWDNWADFAMKYDAMVAAATPLATAAGDGKDAMAAAFGGFAGTCRSCHQTYRGPKL